MFSLNAIEGVGQGAAALTPAQTTSSTSGPDFMSMLSNGIDALDKNIAVAEQSMNAFALGEPLSTHDLMIAMEKARFSMQIAVEIRNRLAETYAELTRMQI